MKSWNLAKFATSSCKANALHLRFSLCECFAFFFLEKNCYPTLILLKDEL